MHLKATLFHFYQQGSGVSSRRFVVENDISDLIWLCRIDV